MKSSDVYLRFMTGTGQQKALVHIMKKGKKSGIVWEEGSYPSDRLPDK